MENEEVRDWIIRVYTDDGRYGGGVRFRGTKQQAEERGQLELKESGASSFAVEDAGK